MLVNNEDYCLQIEQIISIDPGLRGINKCFSPGNLYKAANRIINSNKKNKSFILTGFCCMRNTCETDGPLGSSILCQTLNDLGFNTSIICDSYSGDVVKASALSNKVIISNSPDIFLKENISFIISIERPGRSEKTNDYRTCKGRDISNVTAPLDELFPNCKDNIKKNYLTVGVGDGGNEVGTGNIIEKVKKYIPFGEDICTISTCDILIMAGVSNWGGIAIAAALVILSENIKIANSFFENSKKQKEILNKMIEKGSYDGISGDIKCYIDGMEFEKEHQEINDKINQIIKKKYSIK